MAILSLNRDRERLEGLVNSLQGDLANAGRERDVRLGENGMILTGMSFSCAEQECILLVRA